MLRNVIASFAFFAFLGLALGLTSGCGKDDTAGSGNPAIKSDASKLKDIKKITPSGGGEDKGKQVPVVD